MNATFTPWTVRLQCIEWLVPFSWLYRFKIALYVYISLRFTQVTLHTNPLLMHLFFCTSHLVLCNEKHSEPSNPKEKEDKSSRYGLWIKKLEYW